MSDDEIDIVFGKKGTEFDAFLSKYQAGNRELRERNVQKSRELAHYQCMAVVLGDEEFCGASQGLRCGCTGTIDIDTKKKGVWNQLQRRFGVGEWASNNLVNGWESIDNGIIRLCDTHKRRIQVGNPAMWAAFAVAAAGAAWLGAKGYQAYGRYSDRKKIDRMVAADAKGRAFHITEDEAKEFDDLQFLSPEEKMAYLKNREGWMLGDNERNLGFSSQRLLSSDTTRSKWDEMNRSLREYTLDDDGLTAAELEKVRDNVGIDMPYAIEKNKYVQFDQAMKREAGQGFAAVGAEKRLDALAREKGIDWDSARMRPSGPLNQRQANYFQEAVRRRDATQAAIDRAMRVDRVPTDKISAPSNYQSTWATKITRDEMDEIRAAAGIKEGPIPEHMQTLLDDPDVKTAIGKGIVSDVVEASAAQKIFTDADLNAIERAKQHHRIDASIEELQYLSPSIRTAMANRKRYEALRNQKVADGLLDRADEADLAQEMANMQIDTETARTLVDSDAIVQQGKRAMDDARKAAAAATSDMYISDSERQALATAKKAFRNEQARFGESLDLTRLNAAEENTRSIQRELQQLQADDTTQAVQELTSYDMLHARKSFVNKQQDMLQRVQDNPAFSAAVQDKGYDAAALVDRGDALDTEARTLARSVRQLGRSAKQRQMYESTGMVGSDQGSAYVSDTLQNRAKFGMVRNEAMQNRVQELKMEAAGIRECVSSGDCSAFDYDTPGDALDALSRIESTADELESSTVAGKGMAGKVADAILGEQHKFAQGAQTTASLIEETFTHGGQQPDRIERWTENVLSVPSSMASTAVDAGLASTQYAKKGLSEAGARLYQTGRVLNKATGEWMR